MCYMYTNIKFYIIKTLKGNLMYYGWFFLNPYLSIFPETFTKLFSLIIV